MKIKLRKSHLPEGPKRKCHFTYILRGAWLTVSINLLGGCLDSQLVWENLPAATTQEEVTTEGITEETPSTNESSLATNEPSVSTPTSEPSPQTTTTVNSTPVATQLKVSISLESSAAGSPVSATIEVLDSQNNLVTNYLGTVTFASSDSQAELPVPISLAPTDGGTKTVTGLVFKTTGNQTFAASASSLSSGTDTITVTPDMSSQKLAFTTQPGPATGTEIGSILPQQPTVRLQDQFGNLLNNSSKVVTLSLKQNNCTTTGMGLSGTISVTLVNGVATFTNIGVQGSPGTYQLIATAPEVTASDCSDNFTYAPPPLEVVTNAGQALSTNHSFVVITGKCTSDVVSFNLVPSVSAGGNTVSAPAGFRMADTDCSNETWSTTPFAFPAEGINYTISITATLQNNTTRTVNFIASQQRPTGFTFTVDSPGAGVPITFSNSTSSVTLSGTCYEKTGSAPSITVERFDGTSFVNIGAAGTPTCSPANYQWTTTLGTVLSGYNQYRIKATLNTETTYRDVTFYRCGQAATAISPSEPTGTAGTYQIETPEHLEWMKNNMAIGNTLQFNRSIDLQCRNFAGFSNFNGTITGNHHSIVNWTTDGSQGFIVASGGSTAKTVISNFGLHQINLTHNNSTTMNVGGLIGAHIVGTAAGEQLSLSNVRVSGRLSLSGTGTGNIGLIAGYVSGSKDMKLEGVESFGEISTSFGTVGGVVGYLTVSTSDKGIFRHVSSYTSLRHFATAAVSVGGIIGNGSSLGQSATADSANTQVNRLKSVSMISVLTPALHNVGGVCGLCSGASIGEDPMMEFASFEGEVFAPSSGSVGGIMGSGLANHKNLSRTHSKGTVIGKSKVGGILGSLSSSSSAQIQFSYSTADLISKDGAQAMIGGILGYVPSSTNQAVARSYFLGSLTASATTNHKGLIIGQYSTADLSTVAAIQSSTGFATGTTVLIGAGSAINAFTFSGCDTANGNTCGMTAPSGAVDFTADSDGDTIPNAFEQLVPTWTFYSNPTTGQLKFIPGSIPTIQW